MKTRTFSITINGDRWTYKAMPREKYDLHDTDLKGSVAATNKKSRQMYFVADKLTRGVVIHELWHAYCKYLYLDSSSIDWDQFEEIAAEMLEEKIDLIAKQATQMFTKMQEALKNDERKLPEVPRPVLPADDGRNEEKKR